MRTLDIHDLEPNIGVRLQFSRIWEDTTIEGEMTLTKVERYELHKKDRRLSDTSGRFRKEPFSAFFEAIQPAQFPQGNYNVTGDLWKEPADIFITCRGPNDTEDGFIYEAVFS